MEQRKGGGKKSGPFAASNCCQSGTFNKTCLEIEKGNGGLHAEDQHQFLRPECDIYDAAVVKGATILPSKLRPLPQKGNLQNSEENIISSDCIKKF